MDRQTALASDRSPYRTYWNLRNAAHFVFRLRFAFLKRTVTCKWTRRRGLINATGAPERPWATAIMFCTHGQYWHERRIILGVGRG